MSCFGSITLKMTSSIMAFKSSMFNDRNSRPILRLGLHEQTEIENWIRTMGVGVGGRGELVNFDDCVNSIETKCPSQSVEGGSAHLSWFLLVC